jgi:hypothetical protein
MQVSGAAILAVAEFYLQRPSPSTAPPEKLTIRYRLMTIEKVPGQW